VVEKLQSFTLTLIHFRILSFDRLRHFLLGGQPAMNPAKDKVATQSLKYWATICLLLKIGRAHV
jgi:hypothetical protein